ncbi:MAG: M23 family metallopeptidase [Pseudomonadota bacterium]
MNIIILREAGSKPLRLQLSRQRLLAFAGFGLGLVVVVTGALGFFLGDAFGLGQGNAKDRIEVMQASVAEQLEALEALRQESDRELNAMAIRLGELQARSSRVEAVGERLIRIGQLNDGEFSFGDPPAIGGPTAFLSEGLPERVDIDGGIATLEAQLRRQAAELDVLESLIADRQLDESLQPAGRPVLAGWLSSGFGPRPDPFTGEPDYHAGLDFSGREGDDIIAVGDAVVVRATRHHQYGLLVDLDHGNGYLTRYAHNSENLVSVGDRVRAGDVIAKMGNTGRSTGVHLHFEVWYQGRRVDPSRVVAQIRG